MEKWIIKAPKGAEYLSDFLTEIPVNCLFNKKKTGCGATELAIRNSIPTLIAMPYVALVKNKTIYRKDHISVLGVYEGVTEQEIIDYARNHTPLKIAVTYDSLPRTIQALEIAGLNTYKDLFLLIDEWHVLFNAYSFRHHAVATLLDYAVKFERVTYMTATPIEREYILDEIRQLPTCEINWPDLTQVNVRARQTNKPDLYIIQECQKVLLGNLPYNLHIFVNSVQFIARVINALKATSETVKVVCSTSGESRQENQNKLGEDFPISQPSDLVKKINFYTSTCFEGCDIYDENGVTFIVSDGRKAHTQLDISTLFTQICGRVRNSRYKTQIILVYSSTKYSSAVTLDDFVKATKRTLDEAKSYAAEINSLSEATRIKTLSKIPYINEQYVRIEDNKLVVDKNLANIDIVNFKICHQIYATYITLTKELRQYDYKIVVQSYDYIREKLEKQPSARIPFKDLFNEYSRLKSQTESFFVVDSLAQQRAVIERRNPLVKQAYEQLGIEKVKALKYHVGNIRRELVKGLKKGSDYKIVKMIDMKFQKQEPIPKSQIKEDLQAIYDSLGLKQIAKATDLARWYETKDATIRRNGKQIACITIIRDKWITKE